MDRREFIRSSTAAIALAGAGVRIGAAAQSEQSRQAGKPGLPTRTLGKTGQKVTVLILGGVAAMKDPPTEKFHPAQLA